MTITVREARSTKTSWPWMPRQTSTGPPGREHPELVAVPAARQDDSLSVCANASRTPGPGAPWRPARPRDHRIAPDHAVVNQHLPEPGQVAGGRGDAAVVDGGTQRIAGDLAVPFGPHRLPDQRRDQVRHPGPAGPLAHPAEHVGVGRAVGNSPPCGRPGPGWSGRRMRPRVAGLRRAPAHRALHHPDLGVQLGVGLAERHPGPHVEQMADGGPGVPEDPASGT